MFLPAGLALGAFMMFFLPTLGTAIFSRSVDGSLKQSLHRAGVEMLYLPVNIRIKNRIKTYIDVLVDSAAGGVGGLLLIILIDTLGFSPAGISILVAVLAIAWLACVLAVREEYLDAFRDQLSHLRPQKERRRRGTRHQEVLSGFLKILEDTDPQLDRKRLLYVLERTENMQDKKFLKPTEQLLFHKDPEIRARALHNLSVRGQSDIYDLVVFMLDDDAMPVKKAALEYLINNHLNAASDIIEGMLRHENPEIAGLALIDLIMETRGNQVLRRRWRLDQLFAERVAALDEMPSDLSYKWKMHLLVAAGRSGTNLGNQLIERHIQITSVEDEVVKVAIIAAGETLAERWLLPLIDFLSERPYRRHATLALAQYGDKLIRLLPRYLRDGVIDILDVRRLPAVVEGIRGEQTVTLLFSMMEKHFPGDLELRLEVLRSLNAIRRDFPELQMPAKKILKYLRKESKRYRLVLDALGNQLAISVAMGGEISKGRDALIQQLQKRREGNLDRLFRLLGLYYAPADIIPIYRGLRTAGAAERVNALEFLDTLLDNSLKQTIMPLVEHEVRARVAEVIPQNLSLSELEVMQRMYFTTLLKGTDMKLKAAVLYLLQHRPDDKLIELVRLATRSPNAKVRKMANQVLTQKQPLPVS